MKESKLKVVETLPNTEVIYKMMDDLAELIDEYNDTSSCLRLTRNFTPEDEDLKKVQNGLKSLLDSPINKSRGSNILLELESEIFLAPSNDEEKEMIDVIINNFEGEPSLREMLFNTDNLNYLNTVGQSSSKFQSCIARGTNSYVKPDSDLNLVNSLCTFNVTNVGTNGHNNPRRGLVSLNGGVPTKIYNSVCNNENYARSERHLNYIAMEFFGYNSPFYNAMCNAESEEEREDAVNSFPIETISPYVSKFYSQLRDAKEGLDNYIKSNQIALSDFLKVVPVEFLDAVEELKKQHTSTLERLSKIQRKVVTVSVIQNITIEMDTTGDSNDIKKVILEKFPDHYLGNHYGSEKGEFFESPYEVNITDLEIKSVEDKAEKEVRDDIFKR